MKMEPSVLGRLRVVAGAEGVQSRRCPTQKCRFSPMVRQSAGLYFLCFSPETYSAEVPGAIHPPRWLFKRSGLLRRKGKGRLIKREGQGVAPAPGEEMLRNRESKGREQEDGLQAQGVPWPET